MMKKLTILLVVTLSAFAAQAANNSIAFIQGGSNCQFFFRDSSSGLGYTPTTFYWNFGDGNTSASQHAIHTYASNGVYNVKHIVSNGSNRDTAFITLTVNCSNNMPLKADFYFNVLDTVPTRDVTFFNISQGTYHKSRWDFGDGNYTYTESPKHIYSANIAQSYTVTLEITDTIRNISDTVQKTVFVPKYDPCKVFKAYFTANRDQNNCMKINFINYSHYSATNFVWDFGNGASSSSMNPSYTYSSLGYYTVKMKASNSQCGDSQTQVIRVTCRTCFSVTAKIVLDVDSTNPSKAKLYNYSYGVVNSHFWDFGDGNTSTAAAPTHVYTSPGKIHLMYVVRDTASCYDTAYIDFEIDSLGNIKRGGVSFTLEVINRINTSAIARIKAPTLNLNIYPNPAQNEVNIRNISKADQSLIIYNNIGQIIGQLSLPSQSDTKLNTDTWPCGLYTIKDSSGAVYRLMRL